MGFIKKQGLGEPGKLQDVGSQKIIIPSGLIFKI